MTPCICGKSKPFEKCCGRFLSGEQHAKTPEQLMRSRYAAYALGDHGDYLMATWLPATAQGLNASTLSEKTFTWTGLKIIASSQKGDTGEVEFEAQFHKPSSPDAPEMMHEVSEFVRIQSRWYYVGGQVN